jgi:hypothetical protein
METRTATAAEIRAERWRMATTRPLRWTEGRATISITQDNSKAVEAILHGIETLGARLVEEVHEDELDSLAGELAGELVEGPVKDALFAWADRIVERRACSHRGMRRLWPYPLGRRSASR